MTYATAMEIYNGNLIDMFKDVYSTHVISHHQNEAEIGVSLYAKEVSAKRQKATVQLRKLETSLELTENEEARIKQTHKFVMQNIANKIKNNK